MIKISLPNLMNIWHRKGYDCSETAKKRSETKQKWVWKALEKWSHFWVALRAKFDTKFDFDCSEKGPWNDQKCQWFTPYH